MSHSASEPGKPPHDRRGLRERGAGLRGGATGRGHAGTGRGLRRSPHRPESVTALIPSGRRLRHPDHTAGSEPSASRAATRSACAMWRRSCWTQVRNHAATRHHDPEASARSSDPLLVSGQAVPESIRGLCQRTFPPMTVVTRRRSRSRGTARWTARRACAEGAGRHVAHAGMPEPPRLTLLAVQRRVQTVEKPLHGRALHVDRMHRHVLWVAR